ncbi:MAG: secretion protein [Chthoniobacteraceae bacterium]|nr:secretion protein [Chthoniobacteraceae bacterium]
MNLTLPRFRNYAVALACSIAAVLVDPAMAETTTATTTPVGFITVTVPAATNATTPSSRTLSIPLYNTAAYAGAVASVDSSSAFTIAGAAWTANQFTTAPHFVRVKTGAQVGRFFLIASHTANQLTLSTNGANLTTLLAANDTVEIVPANTLGSVFGTTTPLLQSNANADLADKIFIWNGTAFDTYFHNGTNWRKTTTVTNANTTVLYPDEGFFVTRVATTPVNITLMGTVPSTAEKTDLAGAGSTFIANRFPVDIAISALGLQQTAGWTSGPAPESADSLYVWNGTTWDTYFYNGTNWRKTNSLKNQDAVVIPTGTAMFITRINGTTATLAQVLPYTP